MLNTGHLFFGCASLINFLLSLPCIPCFSLFRTWWRRNLHTANIFPSQRSSSSVLTRLFICPPYCFSLSLSVSDIHPATLTVLRCTVSLFLSHFLILSLLCLFRPLPIFFSAQCLDSSLLLIPVCPPFLLHSCPFLQYFFFCLFFLPLVRLLSPNARECTRQRGWICTSFSQLYNGTERKKSEVNFCCPHHMKRKTPN